MKFVKYQALGNDYIVIDPADLSGSLTSGQIRRVCDRHYGPGSDGILLGPLPTAQADFALRIFNPDGSEAEKSGNGLRIFSRYLWDRGLLSVDPAAASSLPFSVHTPGGVVQSQVLEGGRLVRVEMGQASFDSTLIPVAGPPRQVLDETMEIGADKFGDDKLGPDKFGLEPLTYCAVTLGNPHCVVLSEAPSEVLARRLGPLIEVERRFPNRTNVQFLRLLDHNSIQIHIWERGAGYTLASGSSSCAAAAVAYRLGWVGPHVAVHNPGGLIQVDLTSDFFITMTGPVEYVYSGEMELDRAE
jgi:diaminopimelate epimerase